MLNQYTDECTSSLIFPIPIWLKCSYWIICFCIWSGIIILLPFIIMPSIIAHSFLIGQYCLMPWGTSYLLCGQLFIIHALISWRCVSSYVTVSTSSFNYLGHCFLCGYCGIASPWYIHLGQTCIWSVLSTVYWCIHSRMYCNHYGSIATSLLSKATNSLCSEITHSSLTKQ